MVSVVSVVVVSVSCPVLSCPVHGGGAPIGFGGAGSGVLSRGDPLRESRNRAKEPETLYIYRYIQGL